MRPTPEGPYFDDLSVGDSVTSPSVSLTTGRAAVHQSILGGRLQLSLDRHVSIAVAGRELADPGLVWDVAIGQSTAITRRVVANLFYRGLAFHHLPSIGDSLSTRTEVVGLRQNASRPSGLAALRITTHDQEGKLVLDFWRCAMLPLSHPDVRTGHVDDLSAIGTPPALAALTEELQSFNLAAWNPPTGPALATGSRWRLDAGDVVSSAPELARLTLNLAHVHHDRLSQSSGRLVYGGHTIGIALTHVAKTLPHIVTVGGWHGCDHLGPVREGDTLASTIEVVEVNQISDAVTSANLRVTVRVKGADRDVDVLDWHPIVLTI